MRTHRKLFLIAVVCLALSPAAGAAYPELFKLTASDANGGDEFGAEVAISGNTAIVGAFGNDDAGGSSGSAYLFDVTTGAELFKLTASDAEPADAFGGSVGISGNTAIVGAYEYVGVSSGSAYLFDVTTGAELFKLAASDVAVGAEFGRSVAISGDVAIVGAQYDDEGGESSGSAYLFDVTTGAELFKLTASDAAPDDDFGRVGISGNSAIVGASSNDDAGEYSGSAYLFDVRTGAELFKLTASDAAAGDQFGADVAISDNVAIVGASGDDDGGYNSGSAYLFDVTTGAELFKLTASDAAVFDQFGLRVAVSGDVAIVGALRDDEYTGSAYLFDVTTGAELFKLTASDAAVGDYLGWAVGIDGDAAIVGARGNDDAGMNSGSAYIYQVPEPATMSLLALGGLGLLRPRHRTTVTEKRSR